jgi:hypothetical protein
MAQMPGSSGMQRSRQAVGNDIFTVFTGIALAIVLGTIAFVIYRCVDLFGRPFPVFPG